MARCATYQHTACLTLTAIHPDGQHRTPSRHVPLDQPDLLREALTRLLAANAQGWGAFVAMGLRRRGLSRFRRGGEADLLALPALFVDVDDPSPDTLRRLQAIQPEPSCITFTGGGFHAYWWLDEPLADMQLARQLLRGLQREAGGDLLSVAQSLRLVGTRNTKPDRQGALCRIVELQPRYYPLSAFEPLLPLPTAPPPVVRSRRPDCPPCVEQPTQSSFAQCGERPPHRIGLCAARRLAQRPLFVSGPSPA